MAKHDPDLSLLFHALADPTRRSILTRLAEGPAPVTELAAPTGLRLPTVMRHLSVLEEAGLIAGYAARLDPKALGLDLQAFVEISLTSQSRETMDRFETAVADFPEILECHLMAGQADYLLRVAAETRVAGHP